MSPAVIRIIGFACSLAAVIIFSYRHGVTVTDTAWQAKTNLSIAEANARALKAEQSLLESERAATARINTIEAKHYEEDQAADAEYNRRLAAVASGAVRLRDRFTCPSTADKLPGAAASAGVGQPAESAGLQPKDAGFLVSEARRADEITRQLAACQAIIASDRKR